MSTVSGGALWTQQKERSHAWLLRLMVWISLTAGRTAGRVVLRGIALYFVLFAPAARQASRQYLERIQDRPATWAELYRHVLWFASTIHDRVFLLSDQTQALDVEVSGADELEALLQGGRGAFLIGAHLGSFEVMRTVGRQRAGLRVAMAMHEAHARKLNDSLRAINPAAMDDVIALGQVNSMLAVRERLDDGWLVGMLADRSLEASGGLDISFLGHSARFPQGPWRLALMLQRPVFFMTGLYLGGNRYQVCFERLADFSAVPRERRAAALEQAMRDYVATLERHVHQSPYNWFNFYDFWQCK